MRKFTMMMLSSAMMLGGASAMASVGVRPLRSAKAAVPYKANAALKAGDDKTVISEAPEGKVLKMTRSGMAYYTFFGEPTWGEYYGMCAEIVECENGDVYLKDPISHAPSYSYIKGKKEGSKVVFDMPQAILSLHNEDGSLMYFYTDMFQFSEEYKWFFRANSSESEQYGLPEIEDQFVVEVGEDGSFTYLAPDEGDIILGLYSDASASSSEGSWMAFGEAASVWEVFDDEYVSAPGGLEYKPMAMTHEDGAYFVSVGFDGNDVYFKGLFKELPQSIVKGELDGDRVVLKPGQYIGISTLESGLSYYTYLMTAKAERVWNERYELWETSLEKTDSFTFIYDKEMETLTTADDMSTLVMNCGDVIIDDVTYLINPTMVIQAEGLSRVPANPYNVEYVKGMGMPYLSFDLPVVNVDGDVLDINNLYYKIYVDGDEFTFYGDEIVGLGVDERTMVPYSFQNVGNDFMVNGYNHIVYLDVVDAETFGVQLLYAEDGEVLGESKVVAIAANMSDATKPADPFDVIFNDSYAAWGLYSFSFRLPDYNVLGDKLDVNNLYYKIFVNGDEFTLTPNEYPGLSSSMSLIPYSFNDEKEYDIIATGSLHTIDFPKDYADSYGVQLYYIVDDVIYGQSNIVTYSMPTKVEEISSDKEIASERYYNLSGSEVANPKSGVFIKVVTYIDGGRKSEKVVNK